MPREVKINGTTFIVNSYSAESATETLDELLKRVIVSNAEREFKKRPYTEKSDPLIPTNTKGNNA